MKILKTERVEDDWRIIEKIATWKRNSDKKKRRIIKIKFIFKAFALK